jgi:hypothetical protein
MKTPDAATFDNLTDGEVRLMAYMLQEEYPQIAEEVLGRVSEHRTFQAARDAMGPHPYTATNVPGTVLCYWRTDGFCLRAQDDPLHTLQALSCSCGDSAVAPEFHDVVGCPIGRAYYERTTP